MGNYFGISKINFGGGLTLFWKREVELDIDSSSLNYIDVIINKSKDGGWRFTGFYSDPETQRRMDSWNLLRNLQGRFAVLWLCAGDFNDITMTHKKKAGWLRLYLQMKNFRDVLDKCSLMDLGYAESKFTWFKNLANGVAVWERLDKALGTTDWFENYPTTKVIVLEYGTLDHKLMVIHLDGVPVRPHKPWRFEQMWLEDEGCNDTVASAWRDGEGSSSMGRVVNKMGKCQTKLKWWKNYYQHLFTSSNPCELENITQHTCRVVTDDMNERALNRMALLKALGLDGMPPLFYQHYWKDIGDGVIEAVLACLNSKKILSGLNHTYLTLIPKVKCPVKVSDFRPIAFCNVLYKIILKMLANRKAYDRVEWIFRMKIMERMGFHQKLRGWVYECISSISFSILVNGDGRGDIVPSRGLRQGLNGLIQNVINDGKIQGFSLCRGGPKISHLFVTDDSLFFLPSKNKGGGNHPNHFEVFEVAGSGGKNRRANLNYIKDRKLLSQAGKEVLLKAVVQVIPTFAMGDIEMLMRKFWWGQQTLCKPKKEGGLGFKELAKFNDAMSEKQVWRIIHDKNSLFYRVFKSKYFPNGSIFYAKQALGSFTWKSILKSRRVILLGAKWRVGDSRSIGIFKDSWIPGLSGERVVSAILGLASDACVAELIHQAMGNWDVQLIQNCFLPFESGYKSVCEDARCDEALSSSRNGGVPGKKIKHFLWRACTNCLPTKLNLMKRKMLTDPMCHLCNKFLKDVKHALWDYEAVKIVWCKEFSLVSSIELAHESFTDLVDQLLSKPRANELFATTTLYIWTHRNKTRLGEKATPLKSIGEAAKTFLLQFRKGREVHSRGKILHRRKWLPPEPGEFKANFDGAMFSENDEVGVGIVIRDYMRHILAAMAEKIQNHLVWIAWRWLQLNG
ncbi:hypothetical protein ACB092_01G242000 [Castanea dentata]